MTTCMVQEQTEISDNNETLTEDEGLWIVTSEDNLEQSNSLNEKVSVFKSCRHGKKTKGIHIENATNDDISIKETNEKYAVAESSEDWNENNLGDTKDLDTEGIVVNIENSEFSSEVAEERYEGHDNKLGEITEQEVEELVYTTKDFKKVKRYIMEPVIEGEDTDNMMRFVDKELSEFRCDLFMFNGSLHGDVNQFSKVDVAELVMDNPNIGTSNGEINILSETELGHVDVEDINIEEGLETDNDQHIKAIVNICKDEEIDETKICPSDSPMVDFRSKVSKKLVNIYGMGKAKHEKFKVSVDASSSNIDECWDRAEVQTIFVKSNCTQIDSCANKIKRVVDSTLEADCMVIAQVEMSTRFLNGKVKDLVRASKLTRKMKSSESDFFLRKLGPVGGWPIEVSTDASLLNFNEAVHSVEARKVVVKNDGGECATILGANRIKRIVNSHHSI